MKKSVIKSALEDIRSKSKDGMLHAYAVVKAAAKANNPLHNLFTWDDKKAGDQYRLFQARALIRSVRLTSVSEEDKLKAPPPAYVALKSDVQTGGGYRRTVDVVDDEELSESLRETALAELRGWVRRYRTLSELVGAVAEVAGLEVPV